MQIDGFTVGQLSHIDGDPAATANKLLYQSKCILNLDLWSVAGTKDKPLLKFTAWVTAGVGHSLLSTQFSRVEV